MIQWFHQQRSRSLLCSNHSSPLRCNSDLGSSLQHRCCCRAASSQSALSRQHANETDPWCALHGRDVGAISLAHHPQSLPRSCSSLQHRCCCRAASSQSALSRQHANETDPWCALHGRDVGAISLAHHPQSLPRSCCSVPGQPFQCLGHRLLLAR